MCYVARVVMRNDIIFIISYIRRITQYEIFIKNTYEYSLELFTGRHIWDRKRHKRTWRQQEFAVFKCETTANSVTGHVCVNTNLVRKM